LLNGINIFDIAVECIVLSSLTSAGATPVPFGFAGAKLESLIPYSLPYCLAERHELSLGMGEALSPTEDCRGETTIFQLFSTNFVLQYNLLEPDE